MHPELVTQGPAVTVVESDASEDRDWDSFLEGTALGQFQQSSMWGRSKAMEGWRPSRVTLRHRGKIHGGFQALWRPTRFGRIAYLSKGPVLTDEDGQTAVRIVRLLQDWASRMRCRAVVVQPPDRSIVLADCLRDAGCLPNKLTRVIDATLLLDLKPDMASLEPTLPRSTRRSLRLADRSNLSFIEGSRQLLPEFFALMCSTCARQKTAPNPATINHLEEIWKVFSTSRKIRLFLVQSSGQWVSGAIGIQFGQCWTHWKKGWNGEHGRESPNEYLDWQIIKTAGAAGFGRFDFGSFQRATAEAFLEGKAIPPHTISPRDRFNLSFGGHPALLPKSSVWFPHPILRLLYRLGTRFWFRF